MKHKLLPKALDGKGGKRACFDLGIGICSTEPHFHDCVEIVYMKSGTMRLFLDCEWVTVAEGDTVLIPPGCIHSTSCRDENAQRAVVGFYSSLICDATADERAELMPFLSAKFNTGCVISQKNSADIADHFGTLIDHSSRKEGVDTLLLYSEVVAIYRAFYLKWKKEGMAMGLGHTPLVSAILDYVRTNFHLSISAASTAGKMNISYSYMARLLSESLGYGFCELLLLTRIDAAKKLLTSTDLSVTDVGYECGFSTTSAFIESFRKKTGKTPLAYRKTLKTK